MQVNKLVGFHSNDNNKNGNNQVFEGSIYPEAKDFLLRDEFDYGKLIDVTVDLEAISDWYEMRREQTNFPVLSVANPTVCSFCLEDLIKGLPSVKCLECERSEVVLCINCFKLGAQSGEHRRGHNYKINDPVGPKVFEEDDKEDGWGCFEDLGLLSSFMKAHLDQWPDISKDFGRERSINEALDRIDKFFLRGDIGDHVLKCLKEIPLKLAIDEEAYIKQMNEIGPTPASSPSKYATRKSGDNVVTSLSNGHGHLPLTPLGTSAFARLSVKVEDGAVSDDRFALSNRKEDQLSKQFSPPHSPISNKRLTYKSPNECPSTSGHRSSLTNSEKDLDKKCLRSNRNSFTNRPTTARQLSRQSLITEFAEYEDSGSCSSADAQPAPIRRRSSVRNSTSSRLSNAVTPSSPKCIVEADSDSSRRNSFEFRASRKEMLENAKSEAAEALRGRLSSRMRKSSLELSEALNWDEETLSRKRHKFCHLSEEKMSWLREKYPNSYFYDHKPQPMTNRQIAKYDEEDLQLLGYMPHRDDFEREYKNEAEQLISRISFPRATTEDEAEVEKFLNAVRFARMHRYNRVLKSRVAKKGVIQEHDMLNEYLNIVKNNISEKGKYNVLGEERFFTSKRREEHFKPLFIQLRQVANKATIKTLARSMGKMESLIDQIEELKKLQRSGVTEIKGKLKVDSLPPSWSKKRKAKKTDNTEQRKAGLRWKRIKRWSKKQHQVSETDE